MTGYVDGAYLEANPTWHETEAAWKANQLLDFLHTRQLHPRSIGDIGCGTGGVIAALSKCLDNVSLVGWDISPIAINMGHILHPGTDIRCGDIFHTDEHYDLVLVLDVFEHVEDYLGFLRGLHRHARQFLFHIPLDMSAQMVVRVKPILKARKQLGHLHYFSKATALATLQSAGYVIVDTEFTHSGLDLPKSPLARLASHPRRIALRVAPESTVKLLGGCSLLVLAERVSY